MEQTKEKVFEFEPMHHFVEIEKVLLKDLKSAGGIVIPPTDEKAGVFKVVGAGPGFLTEHDLNRRVPMSVQVGDYVLVDVHQVMNVSYSGQDVFVVPESGIFGKIHFRTEIVAKA